MIESNEGISFPRASATISADDALFKVMDDDVKVLRVDIDGWSAAAPLFLIKDVMPAFSKACAKKEDEDIRSNAGRRPCKIGASVEPLAAQGTSRPADGPKHLQARPGLA